MAAMPIFGKNIKKASPNRACLVAESLQILSWMGGLPKLLKNHRTVTFDLIMARSSLLPCAFVWEKMFRISNDFLLKPLGQCCSNFVWSLPGAGE